MRHIWVLGCCVALAAAAGCSRKDEGAGEKVDEPSAGTEPTPTGVAEQPTGAGAAAAEADRVDPPVATSAAVATLKPTEGNKVAGSVTFKPAPGGDIAVAAVVTGLTPGNHGFHIHEKGDCSAPDGTSAGGHFNPDKVDHGGPAAAPHHVGDLGNLAAGADGGARLALTLKGTSLDPKDPRSIVNRSVIVHAKPDDLKSQPTGAAGARVACGVIEPVAAEGGVAPAAADGDKAPAAAQ